MNKHNTNRPTSQVVDISNIPAELRDLAQWVVWRYELRGGKWTKVPYSARSGGKADTTDAATWAGFDEVCAVVGQYDGLGFVFSEDDPYCGVDFDDCVHDGVVDPAALAMVRSLDSYSELSVSGTGVHVILRGVMPGPRRKNAKRQVEMYDQERYFTFTGNLIDDAPSGIKSRQKALAALYADLFPPAAQADTARPAQPVTLDDKDLIARMLARPAIASLWAGDCGAYEDDESRADLALCGHLAFWTGRDPERMDRIFRQSGLYRAKWERKDYRERTIDKAIDGCHNTYEPRRHDDQDRDGGDAGGDQRSGQNVHLERVGAMMDFAMGPRFADLVTAAGAGRWLGVQQTYMALLERARRAGRLTVSPGLRGLAQESGQGKTTVRRHLEILQAAKLVELSFDGHAIVNLLSHVIEPRWDTTANPPDCDRECPTTVRFNFYLGHLQDDAFATPHWTHTQRRIDAGLAVEDAYGAAGRLVVEHLTRHDATRAMICALTGASYATVRNATQRLEEDGLILVAAVGGRTGRTKTYTLHPDFENRLDDLRPHMKTAGLGLVRQYRQENQRAAHFDRLARMLARRAEREPGQMGGLLAKRDRADQLALGALDGLRRMGMDPRRKISRRTDPEGVPHMPKARLLKIDPATEWEAKYQPIWVAWQQLEGLPAAERRRVLGFVFDPMDIDRTTRYWAPKMLRGRAWQPTSPN